MVANIKDTKNSWYLGPDGNYTRCEATTEFSAHQHFLENPSLSGLGRSRRRDKAARPLTL